MPGVVFLPDLFYGHRMWADLPTSLGGDGDAVCYVGRAIVGMAPDGRFIAAAADTDLVWLEDRSQAKAAIRDMLGRLPIQHRRTP